LIVDVDSEEAALALGPDSFFVDLTDVVAEVPAAIVNGVVIFAGVPSRGVRGETAPS
jgi:hypothetical protein